MQRIEQAILSRVQKRFAELRDELLAASHELAKSESPNWAQAERLFAASRQVADLCQAVLMAGGRDENEQLHRSSGHGNGAPALRSADRTFRKSRRDYPRYVVRSDALVKIGLTRNRRDEYEHTVPRAEFDAVMKRLGELAGRKHFSAEDVIEEVHCPSYQTYIVISLLKDHGLLTVPRRGMYAFTRPKTFISDVGAIWNSLERNQTENAN
jgi:hypothetical protein